MTYKNPRHLKSKLKKLRRLGKSLSRREFRSKNWFRARRTVSIQHMKIANARNDTLHKMTAQIAASCDIVVIEDLNVSGMMQKRKLARSIADVSWGEFRRMLEYKVNELIAIPKFFPSSKLCSVCWYKNMI